MTGNANDSLRAAVLREIQADTRECDHLRAALQRLEPRLHQASRYYQTRFGSDGLPATQPAAKSKQRSHAENAAIALTRAGQVGKPLKVHRIRQYLLDAGLADEQRPTVATIYSSISRSGLFAIPNRGHYVLKEAFGERSDQAVHEAAHSQTDPLPDTAGTQG